MKQALKFAAMFCGLAFLSVQTMANEHGGGEEPKAEGGGHGGAPAVKEEPKPWMAVQTEVSGLKTKRQQLISSFTAAAESKHHLKPGTKAFNEANAEMVKIHKELTKVTEDYNKQLIILKYRFPERLAKQAERKYEPFELPGKEELEAQIDLNGRLSKTMLKARSQYGTPSTDLTTDGRTPASTEGLPVDPSGDDLKTIRDDDAPLFRK